ncbi:hypothetical protein rpr22_CDSx558 [Rickettsia prowazekii str. Rp22]|uniref:Uncharacterized protein n=1 Tax=Rickettsia prowazekii (strain Rp22) TaxID=449216 RepID=D5AXB7_RICPP|nr:hypothetical protein rpr22_CDSx558 [Rickettsia prowazekii str. Rp22]
MSLQVAIDCMVIASKLFHKQFFV